MGHLLYAVTVCLECHFAFHEVQLPDFSKFNLLFGIISRTAELLNARNS